MKQKIIQEQIKEFLKSGDTQANFARRIGVDASTVSRALKKNKVKEYKGKTNCEENKMNKKQEELITKAVEDTEKELIQKKNDFIHQKKQLVGLQENINKMDDKLHYLKQKEAEPQSKNIYEPVVDTLGDHIIVKMSREQLMDAIKNLDSSEAIKIGIAMKKI